ncbi:MAG TPA: lipopolysaccharide biosynthesis protein [Gemmatimonadaceae bacterium]|nr:lipopolysaccharide biosynthesis protein [Gemmatimonadaceae bacterium]
MGIRTRSEHIMSGVQQSQKMGKIGAKVGREKPDLATATLRGTLWVYASNYSGKILVFLSTVVLARVLMKEEFGLAGYALLIIGLLDVFSDLGIGSALIYHRDDPDAADTAFWLGIGIGCGLFAVSWAVAPFAATFFHEERLVAITRVLALTFPLTALRNVQETLLEKRLAFSRKFIPDLSNSLGKGVVSIALAFLGFGVWSLIVGQLAGTALSVVVYWGASEWRPSLNFARRYVRILLSYGTSMVGSDALAIMLLNVDYLFIGRFLGPVALGVYMLAFRIPELLIKQSCGVLGSVLFPVYATMRDDPKALSRGVLVTMRYVSTVTVPMALGLALVSKPLVLALFGAKWSDAIPVLRAISLYTLFISISFNIGSVYKAQGRPSILMKLSFLRLAILVPAMWWAAARLGSINAVAWSQAVVAFIGMAINLAVATRTLNLTANALLRELRPVAIGGSLMTLAVLAAMPLATRTAPSLQVAILTIVGAAVYLATMWWVQRAEMISAYRYVHAVVSRSKAA